MDRPVIIAEHDEKCLSDPLHKAIEADITAMAVKNTRTRARSTMFFDVATGVMRAHSDLPFKCHYFPRSIPAAVARQNPVDAAILAALDYNSVGH